ncbi:RNA dependent RNA polymerase-domain-containing protein [Poronia punctata]|nr:RNA dependent RNA polymerase-domain-containing protein [Poronia punctata]
MNTVTRTRAPQPRSSRPKPSMTVQSPRPATRARTGHAMQQMHMRPDWKDWPSLAIRLSGLPNSITTLDLAKHFHRYGRIAYIEIHEPRRESAQLRFSPPPSHCCWDSKMLFEMRGKEYKIRGQLLPRNDLPQVSITPGGPLYPQRLTMKPVRVQFGVLSRPREFMEMRSIRSPSGDKGTFSFLLDLRFRAIDVVFSCNMKDPRRAGLKTDHPSPIGEKEQPTTYKAQIFLAHLTNLVVFEDETTFSLLIPLRSPPVFLREVEMAAQHSEGKSSWNESDAWVRAADINYDTGFFQHEKVALHRKHQFLDIGRWTTYKFTFEKDRSTLTTWDTMRKILRDYNVSIHDAADKFSTVPATKSTFWQTLELGSEDSAPCANSALLADTEGILLPFEVRYQLEVCISQGYFEEVNIDSTFLRKLSQLSSGQKGARNRAKDLLAFVSDSGGPDAGDALNLYPRRYYDPLALFSDRKALCYYPDLGIPSHCSWVRKVVITPSTMYLSSPAPEPSNRVLRKFARYGDRFLRVQFTDELVKGRIYSAPQDRKHNALFNRVFRTLQNGIEVAGRHFQFLAFGNSQFRENGAYFFAPTEHTTCDHIRAWMGDVAHIRVTAKYAARLGQCFSTTRPLTDSPISQSVEEIDDIERNNWCFTDGVGKISPHLAEYVAKPLRLTQKHLPSAFQFRLGGSKGLLVVWPDLKFNKILLRPSQQKFKAQSTHLELIKPSRFSVATLNRQTILILSCLGVPDTVFMNLQKKQLMDYDKALEDAETAMRLLCTFVDQNGVTTALAQMIKDGFMQTKEPFLACVLQVWRAWSLKMLREKARIVVEKSAFVLGCVDETGTLRGYHEPGSDSKDPSMCQTTQEFPQIFLQVPQSGVQPGDMGGYKVVEGLCVVGRNPSLHPGDIRVVEAIDVPALRHLRDVVVFPSTGDRDIPSMCSGGDLDGDDFFVIWDPDLVPPERNHPPMRHDAVQPVQLSRDVRVNDLVTFFVTYMKNDSLCTIAHAHLAQSDCLADGPKDPKCVELAHLHSNAVDYPKSGQPAHLRENLRPKSFPHFMEKPGRSYHSKKILGQLYDVVTKAEFHPNMSGAFDERIIRRFDLSMEMLKRARIVKAQHDRALRQIMNQREIGTEFEVWSTFVMTRPRAGSEYQMQETMGLIMAAHRERFRDACIKVAGSREPEVLYPFIAAVYRVTWEAVQAAIQAGNHRDNNGANQERPMPFISFPWIFDQELGRIANGPADYRLDKMPEVPADALEGDAQDEDDTEYEKLLGLGIFAPKLEDSEGNEGSEADSLPPLDEEELVVLEEKRTGMDELELLMNDE